MSEDKTYILRPEVTIKLPDKVNTYDTYVDIGIYGASYIDLSEAFFNDLFVEFDVDATRKQIVEILNNHSEDMRQAVDNMTKSDMSGLIPLYNIADALLALLGGTTNE